MSDEKALSLVLAPQSDLPILSERFQPRNLTELMSWAKLVVASGIAPKGMNEASVVICVQAAAELRIGPAQAIQNIAVINGRPSIYGDLGKAIFDRDSAYVSFEERAPDEALTKGEGWCRIVKKSGDTVERRFSVEDAKKAGLLDKPGPWQQYRGRMLMWRARWWAMRDADPGVFKGVSAREEVEDIQYAEVEPAPGIRMPKARSASPSPQDVAKFAQEAARGASEASKPSPAPSHATPTPKNGTGDAYDIISVEPKSKGDKKWFEIHAKNEKGEIHPTTYSETFASVAVDCAKAGQQAKITTKPSKDGKYLNVAGIEPIIDTEAPAE